MNTYNVKKELKILSRFIEKKSALPKTNLYNLRTVV